MSDDKAAALKRLHDRAVLDGAGARAVRDLERLKSQVEGILRTIEEGMKT